MKTLTWLLLTFIPVSLSFAQSSGEKDLLLFGEAWLDASDYAWSRESASRLERDSTPGATVKDYGRLRVRFISLDEELLGLDVQVLSYRFDFQLKGEKPKGGVSELEGTRLPPVWLHSALGFSVDSDPASGLVKNNLQTGEIFDLIDFRGFVPNELPKVGEQWNGRMERKPDDRYRFREERDRKFTCLSIQPEGDGGKYEVAFEESLRITSMDPGRAHEIRNTQGKYWVFLPVGRVEEATWETLATEYTEVTEAGQSSDKIETRTEVHLTRRDPPPPKPRGTLEKEEAVREEPPLPPR